MLSALACDSLLSDVDCSAGNGSVVPLGRDVVHMLRQQSFVRLVSRRGAGYMPPYQDIEEAKDVYRQ